MSTPVTSATSYLQAVQKNISCLKTRERLLESTDVTSFSDTQIQELEPEVRSWYPVYKYYGEKLHKESSVFKKALSYFPYFDTNGVSFVTYTKLGQDSAKLDMNKFREFLQEDIKKEIENLASRILSDEHLIDQIMG
ncbi:MAG: hypothetical protein KR126chlam4_00610 [Candidatus Anoxychlamydiales bacterium]|uniref:Uncharacterized protein n=1 Tax=marine sediment metagenome TaxID=412755 RepID=A0A0F9JFD1_9ZZZZ|nr:hypothetical protein [Candidatus Anoxychlamydiales bacterium]NGX40779.1 hypothetical protein [Candidatus Anoxychlamydiales bacterium]HEU64541.1 hypothetical protein [Chlamydiota bacterium]